MREVVAFDRDRVKRITCLGEIFTSELDNVSPEDLVKRGIIDTLSLEIAVKLLEHEKVLITRRQDDHAGVWRYAAEVTVIVPGGTAPVRLTLPTLERPLVMERSHGRETSEPRRSR